jgi:hypothetical protein
MNFADRPWAASARHYLGRMLAKTSPFVPLTEPPARLSVQQGSYRHRALLPQTVWAALQLLAGRKIGA